jgi:hypothetical protein
VVDDEDHSLGDAGGDRSNKETYNTIVGYGKWIHVPGLIQQSRDRAVRTAARFGATDVR